MASPWSLTVPLALAALALSACTLDTSGTAPGAPTASTGTAGGMTGSGGATGSGGSGSGGSGSGSGGMTGSGGSVPGVESCFNGADDDGDGQADCGDPDCAPEYSCVPEAPGLAFVKLAGDCGELPSFQLDTCTTCACTAAAGTCHVQGNLSTHQNCNGFQVGPSFDTSACVNLDADTFSASLRVETTTPVPITPDNNGACAQANPSPLLAACQLPAPSTCATGDQRCAPTSAFTPCVLLDSDDPAACPSGYDDRRRVRIAPDSCGCACNKTADTCAQEVIVYSDSSDCSSSGTTIALNDSCVSSNMNDIESLRPPASAVTCQPDPSPTGTPRVLCCKP